VVARALAVAAAAALAGCSGATSETVTETVSETVTAPAKAETGMPTEQAVFGHIRSLERRGDHYELRFDPAWFLSGETANVAAAEDGAVSAGEPVPNDNYRVEEGHRLLTYLVPDDAAVTVLKDGPDGKPVSMAELAALVRGTSDLHLFEPLESGVWLRVRIDTVREIDQQYRP
jgi:hypothetical protein